MVPVTSFIVSDSHGPSLPDTSIFQAPVPSSFTIAESTTPDPALYAGRAAAMISHNTQIRGTHQRSVGKEAEHPSTRREFFPISDSRSELENMPQSFKRNSEVIESTPKKRTRQSELMQ